MSTTGILLNFLHGVYAMEYYTPLKKEFRKSWGTNTETFSNENEQAMEDEGVLCFYGEAKIVFVYLYRCCNWGWKWPFHYVYSLSFIFFLTCENVIY